MEPGSQHQTGTVFSRYASRDKSDADGSTGDYDELVLKGFESDVHECLNAVTAALQHMPV